MRLIVVMVAMAVTAGCATVRGRAESAFEHERYLEAAELFDQLVIADPADADALAHRDAARDGALAQWKAGYHAAPNAEAAAGELRELLAHRDAWSRAIDVRAEVDQTGMYLTGIVAARTAAAGPLAAEALEHHYEPLLSRADFRARRAVLGAITAGAAEARCGALVPETPYLTWIADRYCAHFGLARTDALPLPELRGGLVVDGSVAGVTDAQRTNLASAVVAAFRASVWFAPGAPTVAARLEGSVAQTVESHEVELAAGWTETVSYTEDEHTQEAYQEPYEDTEQVMVTNQVPCGDTTCPETSWESHSVTKYRTAYRDVTTTVTKYRDEPRVFRYRAMQSTQRDTAALRVHTELADAAVDDDFVERGYDHDVTFAPAGVAPQRPDLLSQGQLVDREQGKLAAAMRAALDARFVAQFCAEASFTAETAARCLYGDPSHPPPGARAALAAVFAGDEPFLSAVIAAR